MRDMSNIIRAYEYRIYPNKLQREQLEKAFGCARWVYNWALNKRSTAWTTEKKNVSYLKLANELPILKKQEETKWLKECPSQCLQMSLRNLDNAYTRFFKKQNQFPLFKSKKGKQSIQFPNHPQVVKIIDNKLSISKIGLMHIVIDRIFEGKVKIITIKKTKSGKYYVIFNVETNQVIPTKQKIEKNKSIGIDVGVKSFLTTSSGLKIDNLKLTKKYSTKLAKAQRKLSRKQKDSNNREKQRIKVAKIHEKIANTRKDFLHKVTAKLTNDSQVSTIFIEDLNISGMLKNRCLAKSIQDCSWSEFYKQLEYKCLWKGINLIRIGRFDPSSKICSNCGVVHNNLTLGDRVWTCESCGTAHDRDLNAAKNILAFGLHPQMHNTVDYTGIHASGDRTTTCQAIDKQARSMKEECSKKLKDFLTQ